MENNQIRTIFFDIGGVLLSNGWGHESRQEAAKKFGLNFAEMDVLHDFIFNVYEIGKITLDDYLDTVVFNHPRDFTKEDFKSFMFDQSVELPDMRVKQLLIYDELTLSEIAWKLNYSSVTHLSKQFKQITGITPTEFKH